ncbi:MAG: hypothetical protein V2J12_11635 [Gammaproteobacteria bacterium]|nr:hypothetical protein [Gammaproteobacteria bacterium]
MSSLSETSLSERVAGERRRLRQVRQALTAATAAPAGDASDRRAFYLAIGDYFEAAMARLHEQDIRMGDMLRAKADMQDPANVQAMAELDERLAGNQEHLQKLLTARDHLRANAAAATREFEQAGGAYAGFIVANMGHHPGTANLAAALFDQADWEHMTLVSEAAQQREKELFAEVFANFPAEVERPADA